jgi:uncharacterized protein
MAQYKIPGVYVEEIVKLPPTVTEVETAFPVFIGYTEKAERDGAPLLQMPTRISSLVEYESCFGGPPAQAVTLWLDEQNQVTDTRVDHVFYLYDSLRLYFFNGGGPCMIVSVGGYSSAISAAALAQGLSSIEKLSEPTIIVMPEAVATEKYGAPLYMAALAQCAEVHNRIVICDLGYHSTDTDFSEVVDTFRNEIGNENLKYGAAYGPWLISTLPREIRFANLALKRTTDGTVIRPESLTSDASILELIAQIRQAETSGNSVEIEATAVKTQIGHKSLQQLYNELYSQFELFKTWVTQSTAALNTIPPGGVMAGIYARVDANRGVWKAPANVSINEVLEPVFAITDDMQETLNVHATGKSINAIRRFSGKGTLVWGARTLAGNDNEWRYISVRRYFNFIEASVKQAIQAFIFEPNDANTWVKIKAMIESFLTLQWRAGALQGAKPEHAFYVAIGLNKTMTALDILEGRMLLEIGLASVRPAEFIILKFSQKMAQN